jgi:hypothetical protein
VMAYGTSIGWKKSVFCPPVRAVAGKPLSQLENPPSSAVMVEPFKPKLIPFEFEKTTELRLLLVVPAEKLISALGLTDAVITDPFNPNVTPLEFEKVTADRLFDVVPALTLMFVRLEATLAVIVEAFNPNETLLPFAKVKALRRFDVVPADTLMLPCVLATVALAVIVDPFRPKLTLFEFENTTFVRLLLVVPPETFTNSTSVPLLAVGSHRVWFPVCAAANASAPAELENPYVTVLAAESPKLNAGPRW